MNKCKRFGVASEKFCESVCSILFKDCRSNRFYKTRLTFDQETLIIEGGKDK